MSTGRETILSRVRAALADVPVGEPIAWDPGADADQAASYTRSGPDEPAALAELFVERCAEYRATVSRCENSPSAIRATVREASARHSARVLAVAPGIERGWIPDELQAQLDDPLLPLNRLDAVDGVLSGCALAIALTGTIVLDGGSRQGRRALTLVPDLHICVVREAQIVHGVPEAVRRMGQAVHDSRAPLTLISGPSATSDIELRRVEGVHGPRRLEVIVARSSKIAPPAMRSYGDEEGERER